MYVHAYDICSKIPNNTRKDTYTIKYTLDCTFVIKAELAKKCQIPWRPFFIWSCYKKTFTFSSTAAVSWIGTFLPDLYLIVFVFWASLHFLIIIMEKEAIQTLCNWTSILARKIYVWAHLKTLKATVDAFRNSTFQFSAKRKYILWKWNFSV